MKSGMSCKLEAVPELLDQITSTSIAVALTGKMISVTILVSFSVKVLMRCFY